MESDAYVSQDFAKTIIEQTLSHEVFSKYDELLTLSRSLIVLDIHLDLGSYAGVDKTEGAIVELGPIETRRRLEYFGVSNANNAQWDARLVWHEAGERLTLLDSHDSPSMNRLNSFIKFACEIGLEGLPFALVLRYFVFTLSPMARENVFNIDFDDYQLLMFARSKVSDEEWQQLETTPMKELQNFSIR